MKRIILGVLLFFACLLAACGPQLDERYAAGDAIVIYPDNGGTSVWKLSGDDYSLGANSRSLGEGYRGAALKPGKYALVGVFNVYQRFTYGYGDKDLDYGERLRVKRGSAVALARPDRLPLVRVDRPPIKELRTKYLVYDYIINVSSEYRMVLDFEPSDQLPASFEVRSGEVIFIPLLRAELSVDEQACVRRDESASKYNDYADPFFSFPLSDNPEDFTTLKWLCPVKRLVLFKTPSNPAKLRQALLAKGKLSSELLEKMQSRDFVPGPLLRKADKQESEAAGGEIFIFDGP